MRRQVYGLIEQISDQKTGYHGEGLIQVPKRQSCDTEEQQSDGDAGVKTDDGVFQIVGFAVMPKVRRILQPCDEADARIDVHRSVEDPLQKRPGTQAHECQNGQVTKPERAVGSRPDGHRHHQGDKDKKRAVSQ